MTHDYIQTDAELKAFCRALGDETSVAIDTEFISEDTFRPVLCLIQVAAGGRLAVIDPLGIGDLRPFWKLLAAPGRETILHAGRSEVEFALAAAGRPPAKLFDTQIAAGMVTNEYPAGYTALVSRILGEAAKKSETRTNWKQRPLTKRQLDYALEDVRHLHALREALGRRLADLGRETWLSEEISEWLQELHTATGDERWRRVSGAAGLDSRSMAVLRELYQWREHEASKRNIPARRIVRDDLIVELARRQTADPKRISAVRGLDRGYIERHMTKLSAHIQRALDLPDDQCPERTPREPSGQLPVIGQFLFAALGSVCRQHQIAASLVGGPNDIREWIAHRDHPKRKRPAPKLARGWRRQFVGRLFEDLLSGKVSIRIAAPQAESPLAFDPPLGM